MKDKVIETVAQLQKTPVEKSYTDSIAEIYRRNLETNQRDNGWWMGRLEGVYCDTTEPESVINDMQKKIPEMITPEKMQELAVRYLDTENYFFAYLVPEK